jgi:sterile alpha motif and leucine zipper-containing kinase AZK
MDDVRPPPRHNPGNSALSRVNSGSLGNFHMNREIAAPDPPVKKERKREVVKRLIANLSYVEMSVVKATAPTDGPPKSKHTRRLVDESWRSPAAAEEAILALSRCPLLNSPIITLKVLSTVHELMQKGSPSVLPATCQWLDHFMLVEAHWGPGQMGGEYGLSQVCGRLIVAYAKMLSAKARFHKDFRAFENNYSFDAERSTNARPDPVSAQSLSAMLSLGSCCREALDVAADILPRDPPLAALQWHRLLAHVGKLVAVEAHLLHGAAVYVAATLAEYGAGGLKNAGPGGRGEGGLPREEARRLEMEHSALRATFVEARARPAMMLAFVEEGGDPALPPGWLGEGEGGERFGFLELPASLPNFDSKEGRAAMASMIASSFGPPSSHTPPPACAREVSPFDAYPSDDEYASASEGGNERERGARDDGGASAEDFGWPVVFSPGGVNERNAPTAGAPLIDFDDGAGWVSAAAATTAATPRPPIFGGYSGSTSIAGGAVPGGGAGRGGAGMRSGVATGGHNRTPSQEKKALDMAASLAAFELTAVRPTTQQEAVFDAKAPTMFKDIAPAGINSQRPPPTAGPPMSMNAASRTNGGGGVTAAMGGWGGNGGGWGGQQQQQLQQQPPPQPQQSQLQQSQQFVSARQQQPPAPPPPPQPQRTQAPMEGWANFDDAPTAPPPPIPMKNRPQNLNIIPPNFAPAVPTPRAGHQRTPSGGSPVPEASFDEIPIEAIVFGKRVGTGAFGEVLKANYQGTDVAVKRLRLDPSQPQAAEDFRRELRVLCGLRHKHVVQFLGACTTGPDLCLVMDFCSNGSLYGVLHNRRQNITAAHVLRWMADTARGMVYLHSRSIIHRDVKSGNLLLDESGCIKVADFGLARAHGPTSNLLTLVGTYPYMAPELLDNQAYNNSVDVYSFGIVMWECLTRDEPFRGHSPMQIVATLLRGERPKLPASPALPSSYVRLLMECWATQPERRPTFSAALDRLVGIAQAMRAAEENRHRR